MATERHGEVPALDCVATHDPESGRLAVFVVNRDPEQPMRLDLPLAAFGQAELVEASSLHDSDYTAANTQEHPDRVQLRPQAATVTDGALTSELAPASWSMFLLDT